MVLGAVKCVGCESRGSLENCNGSPNMGVEVSGNSCLKVYYFVCYSSQSHADSCHLCKTKQRGRFHHWLLHHDVP